MRILAAILALVLALPATASDAGRIVVTGTGVASQAPDMATITLGVRAEAKTAVAALEQASMAMRAVLEHLRAAGVAEEDLQTSDLALRPRYSNRSSSSDGPPTIAGFEASNMLQVRLRDLSGVGEVLDMVTAEGANEFRSLQFGLQVPDPLRDAARVAAVKDAMARATLYAEAAGVPLGPVLEISEAGAAPRPVMRAEMSMMDAGGGVPVAGGELDMRAEVTMIFALGE
ncbi:SIMPL domain-containing protein [Aliiroseovarius subalbicans]|uniref:SIMPL domain-containing protein n=1 Tax=Aliiroseovarius subalbicans TaxID=2925840 RepID=UPI001F5A8E30|nr:SIMPL domain-containing protein [Aliiroseovarius subalbicans]MCI2398091.1 SIMPL domain-containing protein [Aliiroseovarius subalbicans]